MVSENLRLAVPPGTSDIFGARMQLREHALHIIELVYKQFGFEPLSTPILENAIVFNGHHGEGEKILFSFWDKKDVPLVLRYDLTVPLARVMGMYPDISLPFKRYQIAPSFRDDEPDKGHFREFIQCDADIVGVADLAADAETIIMADAGLRQIGFESYNIRVNHRSILRGIAEYICGHNCDVLSFQRSLDFSDKVLRQGIEGIKSDLAEKGFSNESIDRITPILELNGDPVSVLDQLFSMLMDNCFIGCGTHELHTILAYLPKEVYSKITIDFTLARGADYYTGFILEGVIPDIPVGAVLGGGRYDNLMSAAGGTSEPAVGMAFGLDRIITAMEELSMTVEDENPTLLLFGPCKRVAINYAHRLRGLGIMVDFNPCIEDSAKANKYARKRNYPAFAKCDDNGIISITPLKEGLHQFFDCLHQALSTIKGKKE